MIRLIKMRIGTNEQGASLILALAFLALFGLAIGSLLSFADTSIRATVALRSQRGSVDSVDAATQVAINAIRATSTMGVYGGACTAPSVGVNGVTPTVTCVGQPGSGVTTSGTSTTTSPGNAILALGHDPLYDGAWFYNHGGQSAVVGSVLSNSAFNPLTGVDVTGSVSAHYCSKSYPPSLPGDQQSGLGSISIKGTGNTINCNSTSFAQDPGITDTSYALPGSVPTVAATPACTGGVATFTPNKQYIDAAGVGACAKDIFPPGNYYFNFPAGANSTWVVNNNETVIGGTLTTDQKSCDPTKPGALFIFGGASQISINGGGIVTVCASPNTTSQQIAIYGVGHPSTFGVTTATSTTFLNPVNARALDGSVATANLSGTGTRTASLTLQGFPTTNIPSTAVIGSVTIRIRHSETNNNNGVSLSLTGTPGGGTAQTASPSPGSCTSSCDSTFAVPGITTLAQISGLSMVYTASVPSGSGNSETAWVDGAEIEVIWAPAGWNPQTICAATRANTSDTSYSGGLPFVCPTVSILESYSDDSSGNSTLTVMGTIYLPSTHLFANAYFNSTMSVSRGTIVRGELLTQGGTGSALAITTTTSAGPAANRSVLFTVKVAGVTKLQALVTFDDSIPATPGATVTVKSWSVDR